MKWNQGYDHYVNRLSSPFISRLIGCAIYKKHPPKSDKSSGPHQDGVSLLHFMSFTDSNWKSV